MHDDLSKYKQVYNIGSNYRNDIILNNQTVSSYHASVRIAKDGKVYIHDNGSRNGTKVNGVKIEKNKDVRIKKGDNVIMVAFGAGLTWAGALVKWAK
jgi:3-oxoacyl-[acyl-carrier-protein] synthase-3